MTKQSYSARIGERGRAVLPAAPRREIGVQDRDQLLLLLDSEGHPIMKADDAAASVAGHSRTIPTAASSTSYSKSGARRLTPDRSQAEPDLAADVHAIR